MKPADFIRIIGPAARAAAGTTKIPASFTVAQAALESGWGAKAPGMNLFGIKADASWKGAVTGQATKEEVNGAEVQTHAQFRAYPDWLSSIEDHAKFLTENPRYRPAFDHADGVGFARAVAAAGYATDSKYADKLASIINDYNLAALDVPSVLLVQS